MIFIYNFDMIFVVISLFYLLCMKNEFKSINDRGAIFSTLITAEELMKHKHYW